jgi:glucose-1-phosphate thymidylyltransferase
VLVADHPALFSAPWTDDEDVLLVNARLVPTAGSIRRLGELAAARRPGVVQSEGHVAAVLLKPGMPRPATAADGPRWIEYLHTLALDLLDSKLPLLEYPHDIVRHHPAVLLENLEDRLARGTYRELADGVFAAEGATLGQYCVTDTRDGPIVLEAGATVGPFSYLNGPIHLDRGAKVIEHAALKHAVALGHTTKVGGEVEASILEPYSNKQHHGFLGHSYLGSWINFGAGTCNSDLKNTYGQVTAEYRGRKVSTGMQFHGCVVGDYVKTAINTSIFTGKTIGACSMLYGYVTTNVPSFVNYARTFGQMTEASLEAMAATQARMFKRRNVPQRPCDLQLLRDIYELTRPDRQLSPDPPAL